MIIDAAGDMIKEAKDSGSNLVNLPDSFDDISDATGEGADALEEFEPHFYSWTRPVSKK
jgi:hypothetical protein